MESPATTSTTASSARFENRLAREKSPYLLQHKNNPVDWFPWGEEAFEKARKENKPIFLSVGYSTCHWCHVMAHESFENPDIAKVMNEHFVNIKVDREERPDVDKVYMTFVQAISGGGGWPMSVFLTQDLKPFFGGTYYPPADRYGQPGFPRLLKRLSHVWETQRGEIESQGQTFLDAIKESQEPQPARDVPSQISPVSDLPLRTCYKQLRDSFDQELGGFGSAPKFPRPVVFNFLLREAVRDGEGARRREEALHMVALTLTKMGKGGMYDHIGGGFHRYSVDKYWHVPHFEKMLYDQAQLVVSYLETYQLTHTAFFADKARDVMEYVLRALSSPEGGFFSAEDADSYLEHGKPEHGEGAFYVWSQKEIEQLLGEDTAKIFNYHYGVEPNGNAPPGSDPHQEFKGKNVLIQRHPIEKTADTFHKTAEETRALLSEARRKLFEVRERRPHPHLDDKIITAWNGLMISAFSKGYKVLGERKYLEAAIRAASFIRDTLYRPSTGTLIRNYRQGPSNIEAFTDDYAFMVTALLDLYEATADFAWLDWAMKLQETQNKLFWDEKNGGYYNSRADEKSIVLRMKEDHDGAEPSNNSVSAVNLIRLSRMTGRASYAEQAEDIFEAFPMQLAKAPISVPQLCVALDLAISKPMQVILVGETDTPHARDMMRVLHESFHPRTVSMYLTQKAAPFFHEKLEYTKDMKVIDNKLTAYVCENYTCKLPVNSVEELKKMIDTTPVTPGMQTSL